MNVKDMLRQASDAAKQLITLSDQTIIGILKETAQVLRTHTEEVLAANRQDLERMDPANPKYDRLKLTEERLQGIAADMENVSTLPSPLNKVLSETIRPNGMVIRKVTVPFGVIGVIYEARPNVTFDVFSLCFRSGNVCVLRVDRMRTSLTELGTHHPFCIGASGYKSGCMHFTTSGSRGYGGITGSGRLG